MSGQVWHCEDGGVEGHLIWRRHYGVYMTGVRPHLAGRRCSGPTQWLTKKRARTQKNKVSKNLIQESLRLERNHIKEVHSLLRYL